MYIYYYHDEDELLYIGITNDVKGRHNSHKSLSLNGKRGTSLDRYLYDNKKSIDVLTYSYEKIELDKYEIEKYESEQIKKLKPKCNIRTRQFYMYNSNDISKNKILDKYYPKINGRDKLYKQLQDDKIEGISRRYVQGYLNNKLYQISLKR